MSPVITYRNRSAFSNSRQQKACGIPAVYTKQIPRVSFAHSIFAYLQQKIQSYLQILSDFCSSEAKGRTISDFCSNSAKDRTVTDFCSSRTFRFTAADFYHASLRHPVFSPYPFRECPPILTRFPSALSSQ